MTNNILKTITDFIKYLHTLYVNLSLGRRIYYINDVKMFKLDDFVINARLSVNEYKKKSFLKNNNFKEIENLKKILKKHFYIFLKGRL